MAKNSTNKKIYFYICLTFLTIFPILAGKDTLKKERFNEENILIKARL